MKYVEELEGLRGIMSLWVVVGHSLGCLPQLRGGVSPTLYNIFAVDVFIILSGFVIFFMINTKKQNYAEYITQRAFRIFSIYLLATLASILLIGFTKDMFALIPNGALTQGRINTINAFLENPIPHVMSHITLFQGLIPSEILPFSANTIIGQAWSVSIEWQFYIIAPFIFVLMKMNKKPSLNIYLFFMVFSLVAMGMILKNGAFISSKLPMFFVGFLSFFFFRDYSDKFNRQELITIYAVIIILCALVLKGESLAILIWFTALFSTLTSAVSHEKNIISKALTNKYVLYIGKISYSIYMVHMIAVAVAIYILHKFSIFNLTWYFYLPLISIVVTTIISVVTYNTIEKPFIRLGRKISIFISHKNINKVM
ncbi:acyltransferase family protein [Raoultella planticola]|uniref:acyltransferase family protein n=1 Tax=Raoultella planticola TaxID=575 RepID=UPI003D064397